MAIKPTDPYRDPLLDPDLSVSADPMADAATRERENARLRGARLDSELQVDPELDEGRSSGGRIALYGIAILAVLGAIIYGMNSSTDDTAANLPPSTAAQSTAAQNNSAPTPNMPTPANPQMNAAPGVTTGSAPQPPAPVTNGQPHVGSTNSDSAPPSAHY